MSFLFFLIWFLLLGLSRMDSGSGDWDDSDISGQARPTVKTVVYYTITNNASDFHYVARDDHEVVLNQQRELRRKSRKRGAKSCWRNCLRTLKCFQQLANSPKISKQGRCALCVTKCSTNGSTTTNSTQTPQNVGR